MNLLTETKEVLEENNKCLNDIKWIGCKGFTIPIELFKKLADKEYDDGYGGQEVPIDLLVVGDNWWLERHEYDGSEWWEYKELPKKPTQIRKDIIRVIGGSWCSLAEINRSGRC